MSKTVANVEKQYETNPNLKREDVKAISAWLEKQPHLPKVTELQIIIFLQSCCNRVEPTKATIDNFFTVRTLCPDIFTAADEKVIRHTLSVGFMRVLPKYTPEGYMVLFSRLLDTNVDNYINVNHVKVCDMILLNHLYQNGGCKGLVVVFDMTGTAFGHLTRINLTVMKKYLYYVQEAAPVRICSVHYINMVSFTDKLVAMVKPFMKKELVEMLHFHNSLDTLYEFVPKENLPQEYGGQAPPISVLSEENISDLLGSLDLFRWHDSLIVDESKRAGKPKNVGEIFGVDGSFKKLEVD